MHLRGLLRRVMIALLIVLARLRSGVVLGVMILTTGLAGMYVGGKLCDRWLRRHIREAPLKVAVIGTIGAGVSFCLAMSSSVADCVVGFCAAIESSK